MKKFLLVLALFMPAMVSAVADGNGEADKIVGTYLAAYHGEESHVSIFREEDGTYSAQVIWVRNKFDGNGEIKRDEKNPDKSKRNTPCDEIMLIENMSYDSRKHCWNDAKIYDPVRGIRANVSCEFETPDRLKVRGSIMGIGETVYWDKIE